MTKPPEEVMYAMRRALVSFDATYNPQTPDERIRYILAAAEQAGWRLVPVEADEAMERLRGAVGELERAWSFHDRVVASSPDERSAVGQDHYNWCERAARRAIRALQP